MKLVYILIKQMKLNIILKQEKHIVFVLWNAVYMHHVKETYHNYKRMEILVSIKYLAIGLISNM
jgi:hypothetical protein